MHVRGNGHTNGHTPKVAGGRLRGKEPNCSRTCRQRCGTGGGGVGLVQPRVSCLLIARAWNDKRGRKRGHPIARPFPPPPRGSAGLSTFTGARMSTRAARACTSRHEDGIRQGRNGARKRGPSMVHLPRCEPSREGMGARPSEQHGAAARVARSPGRVGPLVSGGVVATGALRRHDEVPDELLQRLQGLRRALPRGGAGVGPPGPP